MYSNEQWEAVREPVTKEWGVLCDKINTVFF